MTDYITTADTSRLIKRALVDAFPGVAFSVRSKSYSMGGSTTIRWTDGPSDQDVMDATAGFRSMGFDGMIDMTYGIRAVLDADGRIVGHKSPGTTDSHGTVYPMDDPVPDGGRIVSFGGGYIFTSRTLSPAAQARADAWLTGQGYDPRIPWTIPRYQYDAAVAAATTTQGGI